MEQVEEINIKNRTYHFFNDMINTEVFDPNLLKIDKKSYKNIDIYCIRYITIHRKNIYSVNPLYLIIGEVDGHIEEKNESKYLVFDSAGENRKVLKKYKELWDEIKNEIETINGDKNDEYGKDCGKLIFNLNIYYIKYIPTKTLDHVDDGRDYLYLFLDDVDGYIEENNGIKHLVFTPAEKNKDALKNYKNLWEGTKKQVE